MTSRKSDGGGVSGNRNERRTNAHGSKQTQQRVRERMCVCVRERERERTRSARTAQVRYTCSIPPSNRGRCKTKRAASINKMVHQSQWRHSYPWVVVVRNSMDSKGSVRDKGSTLRPPFQSSTSCLRASWDSWAMQPRFTSTRCERGIWRGRQKQHHGNVTGEGGGGVGAQQRGDKKTSNHFVSEAHTHTHKHTNQLPHARKHSLTLAFATQHPKHSQTRHTAHPTPSPSHSLPME